MHRRLPSKGLSPLEKKVPRSSRYAHVTATLDTGSTVDKVKYVTAREYAKRRDETFFRITKNQLYELYSEYEQDEYETIAETMGGGGGGGGGASPRIITYTEEDRPIYTKPYLILDVRDVEDYGLYHLLQARSYPMAALRREVHMPELFSFRNQPQHLIILYCQDEKISREAAKILSDRGVDNVYLLTGGMMPFVESYPAFLEGTPPVGKPQSRLTMISEDKSYAGSEWGSQASARRSGASVGGAGRGSSSGMQLTAHHLERHNQQTSTIASGRRTNRDLYSDAGTARSSNISVAESVMSRAAARKGKF
eukprot:gene4793-5254_t